MDVSRARTRDPDEWLESAAEFSRPMVVELRRWITRAEPDLSEAIKWNTLAFSGRKLVCALSGCKAHVGIAFFRGTELADPAGLFDPTGEGNTNLRSIRLKTLDGFDRRAFEALLHAAVELDDRCDILPAPKVKREPWPVPDFFAAALKRDKKAAAGFEALSMSCQREYLVWLSTAKRAETRNKRLEQTLAALRHGRRWVDRKSAG
jgi:hypothetical protein